MLIDFIIIHLFGIGLVDTKIVIGADFFFIESTSFFNELYKNFGKNINIILIPLSPYAIIVGMDFFFTEHKFHTSARFTCPHYIRILYSYTSSRYVLRIIISFSFVLKHIRGQNFLFYYSE